jgi:hypothetical protein
MYLYAILNFFLHEVYAYGSAFSATSQRTMTIRQQVPNNKGCSKINLSSEMAGLSRRFSVEIAKLFLFVIRCSSFPFLSQQTLLTSTS